MSQRILRALGALAFPILTGCGSTAYTVNVTSAPIGAQVSHVNGAPLGEAPVAVNFAPDPAYMSGGCFQVQGMSATWVSGATVRSEEVLRLCNGPGQYHLRLDRPANAPGLAADLRVAMMKERYALEQQRILTEHAMEAAEVWGEALGTILAQ